MKNTPRAEAYILRYCAAQPKSCGLPVVAILPTLLMESSIFRHAQTPALRHVDYGYVIISTRARRFRSMESIPLVHSTSPVHRIQTPKLHSRSEALTATSRLQWKQALNAPQLIPASEFQNFKPPDPVLPSTCMLRPHACFKSPPIHSLGQPLCWKVSSYTADIQTPKTFNHVSHLETVCAILVSQARPNHG